MAIDDLGKLRSDINFLSTASPQQMGNVSRLLQQGQQSDPYESLAFLIANNMQRDMRQPNPQVPQQTILQKRLAETQAQAVPAMGGIPNVGPNQTALQQAAAQNPNMAGIAAAPENVPSAATGGLMSFAHGGEVRGFKYGEIVKPELGTAQYPEEEESDINEDPMFTETDADLENQTGAPDASSFMHAVYKGKQMPNDSVVHTAAPGSSAARNQKASTKDLIARPVQELMDLYGPSYAVSPELQEKFDKQLQGANRDKWLGAIAQGLGSMMSAQTPYFGQALGQGLLSGAAGWMQGGKEEADLEKQMLALRLGAEKEAHADRRAAVGQVYKTLADTEAERRKYAQQKELLDQKLAGIGRIAGIRNEGKGQLTQGEYQRALDDEKGKLFKFYETQLRLNQMTEPQIEQMAKDNINKRIESMRQGGGGFGNISPNAMGAMWMLGPTGILGSEN